MKLRLLVGAALFAVAAYALAGEGINFAKDYATAIKEAGKSNKLVMIDFYTDWCGWCKKLDSDTYSDAGVGKLSQKFVSVKVNAEKEGVDIAKKFEVHAYPTILFVDSKGDLQGKIEGYLTPKDFIPKVEGILTTAAKIPAIQEALKKNPNDGKANAEMAVVKAGQGDVKAAETYLDNARKAKFKGDDMAKAFNAVGDQYQEQREFIKALDNFFQGSAVATDPKIKSYALVSMLAVFQTMKTIGEQNIPRFAQMIVDLKDANPADVEAAKKALEDAKKPDGSKPDAPKPAGAGK